MSLDPVVEADLLDWIGTVEEGENLDAAYALRGTVEATALSILKRRRATTGPSKWSLSGDYSEDDAGARVAWLDDQIAHLTRIIGDDSDDVAVVGRIRRLQPGR